MLSGKHITGVVWGLSHCQVSQISNCDTAPVSVSEEARKIRTKIEKIYVFRKAGIEAGEEPIAVLKAANLHIDVCCEEGGRRVRRSSFLCEQGIFPESCHRRDEPILAERHPLKN